MGIGEGHKDGCTCIECRPDLYHTHGVGCGCLSCVMKADEGESNDDTFTKFDTKKNRLELLEPEFFEGIGKIITFGAEKYSANNWKRAKEEDIERIKGSTLRHLFAYLRGEKVDPETGESHLYHLGCNAMFLDHFDRKEDQRVGGKL